MAAWGPTGMGWQAVGEPQQSWGSPAAPPELAPRILPASSLAASLIQRAEGEARFGRAQPNVPLEPDGVYNVVKIFVGGLPGSCDLAKLKGHFERYGQIEDAVVMMDNNTQRSRGFGYVTFSDSSAVDTALQNYSTNTIDGKWIEVKRCIPPKAMTPPPPQQNTNKGFGKGKSKKGGFNEGFGKGGVHNGPLNGLVSGGMPMSSLPTVANSPPSVVPPPQFLNFDQPGDSLDHLQQLAQQQLTQQLQELQRPPPRSGWDQGPAAQSQQLQSSSGDARGGLYAGYGAAHGGGYNSGRAAPY